MTKAVILAAGKGVRMKSEQPKVLQDILGAPILSHVLPSLREAGITDIIVVVGFEADRVFAYRWSRTSLRRVGGASEGSCRE